jgi:hypothetical protein
VRVDVHKVNVGSRVRLKRRRRLGERASHFSSRECLVIMGDLTSMDLLGIPPLSGRSLGKGKAKF